MAFININKNQGMDKNGEKQQYDKKQSKWVITIIRIQKRQHYSICEQEY